MLKIAFDLGGVISRYPHEMKALMAALSKRPEDVEIHIITDMNEKDALRVCQENDLIQFINSGSIHSADWNRDGDLCKSKIMEKHGIHILVDDRPDYASSGDFIGLVLSPRPNKPYYHPDWKNSGTPAVMVPPEWLDEFTAWKKNR